MIIARDEIREKDLDRTLRAEMGTNPSSKYGTDPFVVTNVTQTNRDGPLRVSIWYTLAAEQTTRMEAIIRNSGVPCVVVDERETIARLNSPNLVGIYL